MRTKRRYGLKYHDGRYLSWDPDHFPLTHDEFEARKRHHEAAAAILTQRYFGEGLEHVEHHHTGPRP